jgi:hypothetical protein
MVERKVIGYLKLSTGKMRRTSVCPTAAFYVADDGRRRVRGHGASFTKSAS